MRHTILSSGIGNRRLMREHMTPAFVLPDFVQVIRKDGKEQFKFVLI